MDSPPAVEELTKEQRNHILREVMLARHKGKDAVLVLFNGKQVKTIHQAYDDKRSA